MTTAISSATASFLSFMVCLQSCSAATAAAAADAAFTCRTLFLLARARTIGLPHLGVPVWLGVPLPLDLKPWHNPVCCRRDKQVDHTAGAASPCSGVLAGVRLQDEILLLWRRLS